MSLKALATVVSTIALLTSTVFARPQPQFPQMGVFNGTIPSGLPPGVQCPVQDTSFCAGPSGNTSILIICTAGVPKPTNCLSHGANIRCFASSGTDATCAEASRPPFPSGVASATGYVPYASGYAPHPTGAPFPPVKGGHGHGNNTLNPSWKPKPTMSSLPSSSSGTTTLATSTTKSSSSPTPSFVANQSSGAMPSSRTSGWFGVFAAALMVAIAI